MFHWHVVHALALPYLSYSAWSLEHEILNQVGATATATPLTRIGVHHFQQKMISIAALTFVDVATSTINPEMLSKCVCGG